MGTCPVCLASVFQCGAGAVVEPVDDDDELPRPRLAYSVLRALGMLLLVLSIGMGWCD